MHEIEDSDCYIDDVRVAFVLDLLIDPIGTGRSGHCPWRLKRPYQCVVSRMHVGPYWIIWWWRPDVVVRV
jgi:hypothetical protein